VNKFAIATTEVANVCEACARILGQRPIAPTPDAIASALPGLDWKALPDWEEQRDDEIAARSGLYDIAFSRALFVVTEASLASGQGGFVVDARDLAQLVEQHLSYFGECFFNGDVVIVEPEGRRVWLFHHEGQYVTISVP